MLVDSHCHLNMIDLTPYEGDLNKALQQARDMGVEHFLSISVLLNETEKLLALVANYPDVSISVGMHPTEEPGVEVTEQELINLIQHPKVKAIGETGLDYYRIEGDMTWQQERFRTHIRVAKEYKKPLIVHTRMAKEDTLKILEEENAQNIGGVLHCFTEDLDMAQRAIDMNFYISFSGIITFKNAKDLQEIAKTIPLDRILVETDCPFLAPVPFRGKPNVPAYVRYTAEFLAELRGIPLMDIATQTTENFYKLFGVERKEYKF